MQRSEKNEFYITVCFYILSGILKLTKCSLTHVHSCQEKTRHDLQLPNNSYRPKEILIKKKHL